MTKDEALAFAHQWIAAWNSRDIEAILAHYEDGVELVSPVAAQLLGLPGGLVSGKAALRDYFARGLAAFPQLRFQLVDTLAGMDSIVLYYLNQRGTHTAEFMQLAPTGPAVKVRRVLAHYSVAS
ncbi:MAG TPA: nuclear transport factor 2 family protein [Terracidiphilus sp.]|nr:nuclear transport factor 2 family protein [Terracidiphilus sp.]